MQPKTILLVEDNADDAALAEAAFSRLSIDHRLIVAADGEAALDSLREAAAGDLAELPCLVLLDLKLPGIDGFEVLQRLRADGRTRFLPVVVLTSSVEERDVSTSYRFGANSYLRKPIDFDEFVLLAEQVARYWLVFNERVPPELSP